MSNFSILCFRLGLICCVFSVLQTDMFAQKPPIVIPVNSRSAIFSPGNWGGDQGRDGSAYRITWNSGAYCAFYWSTTSTAPTATLDISNPTSGSQISYFIDGNLFDQVTVPTSGSVAISKLTGSGDHELLVYTGSSQQIGRWNRANSFTVKGLTVDGESSLGNARSQHPWVSIIGDSITEGIGVPSNLQDYSFLLGQGLLRAGFDYGVSACGYSGWIHPGDSTADVPAYYSIYGSINGTRGIHDDAASRWNKIDSSTSLLDSKGCISGWGGTGQEPSLILINYIVNETLINANISDCQASVTQALGALRVAAPQAWIVLLVPPGLHNPTVYPKGAVYIAALEAGLKAYQSANMQDNKIEELDLGSTASNALASSLYGAGVHYNSAGHAYVAPLLLEALLKRLR